MDDFVSDGGTGLVEAIAAIALMLALFWLMVRASWFARACKLAFLIGWGFAVTGLPAIGALLAAGTANAVPSIVGCIGVLIVGGVSFRYLGWPELRRTLSGPG
jgi:hypothetical protein